jgi:hypothetical protein
MLDSRYAMWMLWGPELTLFCNDAYLPTAGLHVEVLKGRSDAHPFLPQLQHPLRAHQESNFPAGLGQAGTEVSAN